MPLFARAAERQIAMNFGYAERAPDGLHFDTCFLTDRNAGIVGRYRLITSRVDAIAPPERN
jgi:N-carbamoyl-D-amino-acid hydrolase